MLRLAVATVIIFVLSGQSGCASHRSGDVAGERVVIRMLTIDDMNSYHEAGQHSEQFLNGFGPKTAQRVNEKWRSLESKWIKKQGRSPILVALAPVLVGLAVDAVVTRLDEEADSFEAQYSQSAAFDGFWTSTGSQEAGEGEWTTEFVGFEVIRYTKKFPAPERPLVDGRDYGGASRFIVLFARSKSDERLFLLHPFMYANRSAKAKLGQSDESLASKVDLAIDAWWVSNDQSTVESRIATASFNVGGYSLADGKRKVRLWTEPATQAAGWFGGVPVSVDAEGRPAGDGVFRITALITERDEGRTRQTIERVSSYIKEHRQLVVDKATAAVRPEAADATPSVTAGAGVPQ